MEVRGGKNQVYQIHVHWGSTAFESENWTMTGTFHDTTGELTYKDCTRMTLTLKEDGAENEAVRYTDGKGKFLYKNGELYWQAARARAIVRASSAANSFCFIMNAPFLNSNSSISVYSVPGKKQWRCTPPQQSFSRLSFRSL